MREEPIHLTDEDIARFWSKVDIKSESECWNWKAAKNSRGYGSISIGGRSGKKYQAHHISWILTKGRLPRKGYKVCHVPIICHNSACVNPAHLQEKTSKQSAKDRMLNGTSGKQWFLYPLRKKVTMTKKKLAFKCPRCGKRGNTLVLRANGRFRCWSCGATRKGDFWMKPFRNMPSEVTLQEAKEIIGASWSTLQHAILDGRLVAKQHDDVTNPKSPRYIQKEELIRFYKESYRHKDMGKTYKQNGQLQQGG